jgi:hypothetical protein
MKATILLGAAVSSVSAISLRHLKHPNDYSKKSFRTKAILAILCCVIIILPF